MTVLIRIMLIIAVACFGLSSTGQSQKKVADIADVFKDYERDLGENEKKGEKAATSKKYEKLAYNPKMLNMFIANNVGTYLSSSKDISLQRYYAVLESGEGSLFIGYNFMFRENQITRLKDIFNIGFKTNMEENFTNLLVENKLNPELALNLKYTHIFRGRINYSTAHKKVVSEYRSSYLKTKYEEDLKKFNDAAPTAQHDENTELEAKLKYVTSLTKDEKDKLISKEYYAQYEKIAADEEKFITENKQFNYITAKWLTVETYIPLGERKYKVSPSASTYETTDNKFYSYSISGSGTVMVKSEKKKTLYLSGIVSLFNTNNILTKKIKSYKFETIANQGNGNQTVTDSKDAYVGEYQSDFAQSFKAELVWFFVEDIMGVSISGELITGNLSSRNWKMAIPFSLKDKDDKPTINFELQYKEVYGTHSVGISVGYAFGRFFK